MSPLAESAPTESDHAHKLQARTLAQLEPGQRAVVRRVSGHGAIHRRILDMGVCRGALIEVERIAPLGDPIKIKVRGYALSLRRCEAGLIEVIDPSPAIESEWGIEHQGFEFA